MYYNVEFTSKCKIVYSTAPSKSLNLIKKEAFIQGDTFNSKFKYQMVKKPD